MSSRNLDSSCLPRVVGLGRAPWKGQRTARRLQFERLETKALLAVDLTLKSSAADVPVEPGDTIVYTYEYSNDGDTDASGVTIQTWVPAHITVDPASIEAGWVCSDAASPRALSACNLDLGPVAAKASGRATLSVKVDDQLSPRVRAINNLARIRDDGTGDRDANRRDNYASERTAIVRQLHDLQLSLSDGDAKPAPGGTVVYTLSYKNTGVASAPGAVITMRVPRHTQVSGTESPGWKCEEGVCTYPVGDVAAGGEGEVKLTVTVDSDLPDRVRSIYAAAHIADDGSGVGDANRRNNIALERTTIARARPDLTLTIGDERATTTAGGRIVYTLDYANQGSVDAQGVVITVRLPGHTTLNADDSTPGWECAEGMCTLALDGLAANASGAAKLAVNVDAELPRRARQLVARAHITDDGSAGRDANPRNNFDGAFTPVVRNA